MAAAREGHMGDSLRGRLLWAEVGWSGPRKGVEGCIESGGRQLVEDRRLIRLASGGGNEAAGGGRHGDPASRTCGKRRHERTSFFMAVTFRTTS